MPEYPIEFCMKGVWQPLGGHACFTRKDAEDYVATLDPKGASLRIPEGADVAHRAAFASRSA